MEVNYDKGCTFMGTKALRSENHILTILIYIH